MENINFFLSEQEGGNAIIDVNDSVNETINVNDTINTAILNDPMQLAFYYKTTYNVKALNHIMQYYGINKNKMTKDEMIQMIVFFETDHVNANKVFRRIRLWQNIEELKADSYFSKYIMF